MGIFPPFYLLIFEKLSFVFIMFWLRGIRGINLKGKSLLGRKWEPGRTVVYCLYPLWVFLCLCLSQALSKRRRKGLLRATPAMPGMTTREESIDHFPKSARKEAPPHQYFEPVGQKDKCIFSFTQRSWTLKKNHKWCFKWIINAEHFIVVQ